MSSFSPSLFDGVALLVGHQDQPVSPTKKITWQKDDSEMVLIPADGCQD